MGIVHDAQHRAVLGRLGQRRQRRHRDQERVDSRPLLLAERHPQRAACGAGSRSRSARSGRSSRCSAAKASGASDSSPWVRSTRAVACSCDQVVQQRGLPGARLAVHDQRPGTGPAGVLQQGSQLRPLGLAAVQHGPTLTRGDPQDGRGEPGASTGVSEGADDHAGAAGSSCRPDTRRRS